MVDCPAQSETNGCRLNRCCGKLVTETVQCEVFAIVVQLKNLIITSSLAMDRVEIVASVVRFVIVLNPVYYWRAMFVVELYITKYFRVL